MNQAAKVSISLTLAFLLAAPLLATAKKEYFTEDELDMIREAQELNQRVPTYLQLAERRLVFLGIMEKSQQTIEKERKERDQRVKADKKNTDSRANADKAPLDD